MRVKLHVLAVLVAAMLWSSLASAEPPREARSLFEAGRFLAAAQAAEADATAEGQVFVARALLAACIVADSDTPIDSLLARAERAAQAALELAPSSAEARLQLALVYGMRGRRISLTEAFRGGYASRGRALIDEALRLAPDDARAHALLGAWHFEILRRAGRTGAVVYGARRQAGIRAFERALALAPGDPMISLRFATALIESNISSYADRAATLLETAADATPRDALGAYAKRTAAQLGRTLAQQGQRAAAAAALANGL